MALDSKCWKDQNTDYQFFGVEILLPVASEKRYLTSAKQTKVLDHQYLVHIFG
jgi:hypothetical protein